MTQAVVAANYFEGGRNLTRGASEDDADLATIINNLVADIVAAPTAAALALALADTTPASEGASLVGTDAKANLGASTTVEDCLTYLNTANSATAAELASIVGGSEGALLVGTDAKVNLGGATTVEAAMTFLSGQDPPAFTSGAGAPGAVGAIGDIYVDTTNFRLYQNMTGTATGWRAIDDEDLGAVAAIVVTQTGVPVAAQHIDIAPDVYTADGAGDFGFAIGAAEATMDNLIHCIQNHATGLYNCVKLDATHFVIFSAATAHGTAVAASPNIAVSENLANYEISAANLNLAGGRAKGVSQRTLRQVTVAAGDATAGRIAFMFPFVVAGFRVTCRAATGALKMGIADTFAIHGTATNTVVATLLGGGGNIAATDIVTVEAWS